MSKIMNVCRSTCATNFYVLLTYTRNKHGSQQILDRLMYLLSKEQSIVRKHLWLFFLNKNVMILCFIYRRLLFKVFLQKFTFTAAECAPLPSDFNRDSVVPGLSKSAGQSLCFMVILTILFSLWVGLSPVLCIYLTF